MVSGSLAAGALGLGAQFPAPLWGWPGRSFGAGAFGLLPLRGLWLPRGPEAGGGVPGVPSDPPSTNRWRTDANPHVFRFGMACPDQGVGSPQPWGAELFKR
ncbi:hypothetical protein Sgleb_21910 [Streptomyces glebosus]|uniref:Uncharacterized protein n=1 Tax=Streptomyces glebosus TaxID=249580 RepID=A0A640STG6_9ACTN|nr:hypothetical protein Sgleb_21910 [Streptomyces glebosus]GHG76235.1 hypothetical protein GCM10010513_51250 [Streptomyces glebosus]